MALVPVSEQKPESLLFSLCHVRTGGGGHLQNQRRAYTRNGSCRNPDRDVPVSRTMRNKRSSHPVDGTATAAQADSHTWGSLLLGEVWPDSGGQVQTMNSGRERFFLSGQELKTLSLSQPHEFWGKKEHENAQEVSMYRKSKISKRQSNGKGDWSREKQEKWNVSAQATCLTGCRC